MYPLVQALNLTSDLQFNVRHMSNDYPVIAQIKTTLQNFDREFHTFYDLNNFIHYILSSEPALSHHLNFPHRKRCLFSVLGSLSNILFGTETQNQVDAIHQRLNESATLFEKE